MNIAMTHAWLPRATCDEGCVDVGPVGPAAWVICIARATYRGILLLTLLPAIPLLAIPQPSRCRAIQFYCRLVLRCMGVRITKSGSPIRNVPGVLVVSPHVSWVDALVIYAVTAGTFVAKAELVSWPGLAFIARVMNVIPIDRKRLRRLPDVVDTVADRLRSGQTVVAFPEGTTWCGLAHGPFRPAIFQACIDAARPVQPLRLSYRQRDGAPSTAPAFIGDDSLLTSLLRVMSARLTVAHVHVEELQSPASGRCPQPGEHRRDLARRCQKAVQGTTAPRREHALAG